MGITTPYFRLCRPFSNGNYLIGPTGGLGGIEKAFVRDPRYASDSIDLVRGYHQLEKELLHICDFIEPADANRDCYSHELYTLLLRASTEFEANAKAILTANGYSRSGYWNMTDYYKLNAATRLSEYTVTFPIWTGTYKRIQPFAQWATGTSLAWYQGYNAVKHNRAAAFPAASLGNVVTAVAAVFAILFAQFYVVAFDPHHIIQWHNNDEGVLSHDSCVLRIELPTSWTPDECYDFDWQALVTTPMPFQAYSF